MTDVLTAETWVPDSTVRLTNVPWDNSYRDVVEYASNAALNSYLSSRPGETIFIDRLVYLKPGKPIDLEIPFNVATNFNYIHVSNGVQPINGDVYKDFYYFILGVEYISASTTRLLLGLDEFQTFRRQVTFGNCYIDQGHAGVANSNRMNNRGRDYLTIPEGLDMGAEYATVGVDRHNIMSGNTSYDYLVTSTISLVQNPGTTQQPLTPAATGSVLTPFTVPTESYIIRREHMSAYLSAMSNYPWITSGIVSITMIPVNTWFTSGAIYDPVPSVNNYPPRSSTSAYLHYVSGSGVFNGESLIKTYPNFQTTELKNKLPERYRLLDKFTVSPYSMLEVTTYSGSPAFYKPELFRSNVDLSLYQNISIIPGHERIEFSFAWYSMLPTGSNRPHDVFCVYDQFPRMPVLNNGALLAQAQAARGTQAAYESASWGLERTQAGARTAYDNSTAAMVAAAEQGEISRNLDADQTGMANKYGYVNAIMGAAGGGAIGGAAGAGLGAAAGLASAGMQHLQRNEALAMRQGASRASEASSQRLASTLRDNNAGLSDYASRGDYQNTIASLNAQTENLQMTPSTLSGQYGGNFNALNRGVVLDVKFKMVDAAAVRRIGEYWLRFGYKVLQFFTPTTLSLMEHFTYWKMQEVYLHGDINEYHKNVLRGIFEKGVTVWRNADDIGNVDLGDNTIRTSIAL